MEPEKNSEEQIDKAIKNVSATMGMEGIEISPSDEKNLQDIARGIKPDESLIYKLYREYLTIDNKDPKEGEKTK